MKVTVVIPLFNECETLAPLAEQVRHHLAPYEHTILFIDDGSTDGSADVLRTLHAQNDDIHVLRFHRNQGKTAALAAGFARADADTVIMMDADLQDDPKEIPRFIQKIEEGFDVVCGWKINRQDPWTKTIPSRVYNRVTSLLFRLDVHDINCGYKAIRADIAKRLPLRDDMHRLIPVLAKHLGARIAEIPVEHHPRRAGVSKYGIERFWRGIRDTATVFLTTRYPRLAGPGLRAAASLSIFFALLCAVGTGFQSSLGIDILLVAACLIGLRAGTLLFESGRLAERATRLSAPVDITPFVAEELRH